MCAASKTLAELRSQSYIQSLRAKRRCLSGSFTSSHSPELLWPVISNTDRVNEAAGMPAVDIQARELAQGGSEITVLSRDLGMTLEYEELPYEWQSPYFLRVERIYSKGPTLYVCFEVQVSPLESGGARIDVQIYLVPKLPFVLLQPKLNKILKNILAVYQKAEHALRIQPTHSIRAFLSSPQKKALQIQSLIQAWQDVSDNQALKTELAQFIYTAPDHFVNKLRPFELAQLYKWDRNEVLTFFLKATVAGFFNMSWDLLCPSCLGTKERQGHLKDINPNIHCDSCGIDFGARFDDNFELTFYPVATVRQLEVFDFCAGAPSNTAHIVAQYNLWPQQVLDIDLKLAPGQYRMRALTMQNSQVFEIVDTQASSEFELDLQAELNSIQNLQLNSQLKLKIVNSRQIFQTLQIENLNWRANRVTAAYVSSLQAFRHLFSSEALRPGVNLEISNLCIMFTDLKDSTAMYERQGDTSAFNVVQEHFDIMEQLIADFTGGIVKTIGDAIMAVFVDPAQAMLCALSIQDGFRQWNREWHKDDPHTKVILKMGLHLGPCIALNLNNRLDYFGTTVNKSARIQGESQGDDIVISEDVLQAPGVRELLPDTFFKVTAFEKNLKGLSGATPLYRVEWISDRQ